MPLTDFSRLPADARLWIFGAERALDTSERDALLGEVDRFLDQWKAHGAPLRAARDWREDRFLLVAVDEASIPASGCSIDAMVNVLKDLEGKLGVGLVGHGDVYWRAPSGEVRRATRADFRRLAEAGEVDADTRVFDTTLTRVGKLSDGGWERPAREAWHRQAFFRAQPS
jgi:hypothetical protein